MRPYFDKDYGFLYDYYTDILLKLKTGDIMLFSSKYNGNLLQKIICQSWTNLLGTGKVIK